MVHSLKGSGGTYGIHVISDVCHPLEDLLSTLPNNPAKLSHAYIDVALAYIDLLRTIISNFDFHLEEKVDVRGQLKALRLRAFPEPFSLLVVEASPAIRDIIKNSLHSPKLHMEFIHDGYTALGRALAQHFDCIITSNEVPRLNGIALINALQQRKVKMRRPLPSC